ncbi:uncharacterized protein LOC133724739 [Rosa rugosa]|uniref:uncharacterized protein LOC133724739 n=1 Tax=Rosa rugosa TaxID=74645 RepID=UPI002B40388C|nr:uncharacterized protein LOC133724739 [Rosa rugosa]
MEGKNVFYWFPNHKAWEKLKKRSTSNFPVPKQRLGLVGRSINLNFGSTSSTGVGGSINLNFGSTSSTVMEQRGDDHQEIETLPLLPMHSEDISGNKKTTSERGSGDVHYFSGWGGYNGGSRISLELSLNLSGSTDLA